MSTNLVSLAMRFLTTDRIAQIATAMGIDRQLVGKAASAAVPALFASLSSVAAKPGGAAKLESAIAAQDPQLLDKLSEMIESGQGPDLIKQGKDILGGLIGNSSMSGIAGALSKFAGVSQATTSSLLGMLAPAVFAMLGQQKVQRGLDAAGLARLLADQKDHAAAAMPRAFAEDLRRADIPGAPRGDWMREPATSAPFQRQKQGAQPRTGSSALMWLLPVAAIGAFAWWFLSDPGNITNDTQQVTETVVEDVAEPVRLVVGQVDLREAWNRTYSDLRSTLEGVTDVESARSALPKLQAAGNELERLSNLSGQLPEEGRAALSKLMAESRPQLEALYEKVLDIPGVADIARPRIEVVRFRYDSLASA